MRDAFRKQRHTQPISNLMVFNFEYYPITISIPICMYIYIYIRDYTTHSTALKNIRNRNKFTRASELV